MASTRNNKGDILVLIIRKVEVLLQEVDLQDMEVKEDIVRHLLLVVMGDMASLRETMVNHKEDMVEAISKVINGICIVKLKHLRTD